MLHDYVFRRALTPFLASVAALGLLALLSQSVQSLDLIIDQRQGVLVYLQILSLALPRLVALVLPLALFITAIYAVNRMQSDSELVVASAAGMGRMAIASPVIKLSLLVMVLHLVLNLWVQPTSHRLMRERLYEVRTDLAAKMVRPGEFRTPTEGLTIYARDVEPGGRITDLLIQDATSEGAPVTYLAREGVFTEIAGEAALIMYDGSVQSIGADRALTFLKFDSYPLVLTSLMGANAALTYKLSDRYVHELLRPNPFELWAWQQRAKFYAEGHYRLAAPLYGPALSLIALVALIGGQFSRTGYGARIAAASGAAIVVRIVEFSIQSAAANAVDLNWLQYGFPCALILGCLAVLARARGRPGRLPRPHTITDAPQESYA